MLSVSIFHLQHHKLLLHQIRPPHAATTSPATGCLGLVHSHHMEGNLSSADHPTNGEVGKVNCFGNQGDGERGCKEGRRARRMPAHVETWDPGACSLSKPMSRWPIIAPREEEVITLMDTMVDWSIISHIPAIGKIARGFCATV